MPGYDVRTFASLTVMRAALSHSVTWNVRRSHVAPIKRPRIEQWYRQMEIDPLE